MNTPGQASSEVAKSQSPCALSGCRVLEIGDMASAVAGRILADLGADVIKVEPTGGEPARRTEPTLALKDGSRLSASWLAFNVSKRSVCIDLDTPAGERDFSALARTADIIITDFQRVSTRESDRLADIAMTANPAVVFTEVWPFGRGGKFENSPATDTTLQALGGHLFLNGDIDRPPVRIGLPVGIMQGGAEAASAALMAYYHRLRTGQGQRVDISIQECIIWTLLNTTMAWQILGLNEMRGGAVRKERANRFYTRLVWPCADGYIFFGPVGGGGGAAREKSYISLVAWMAEEGITDKLLTRHEWNGPGQFHISQADYDAVTEIIGRFIAGKTAAELMKRAVQSRILLAPVSTVDHILQYDHLRQRGFYEHLRDDQRGLAADYPAVWARLSETPLRGLSPAPSLGEHTDELRREFRQRA
jgi:crotonobetainyl-CoA:carnitine CoA-transferase CaiB-like acyl-CoA transferase